MKIFLIYAGIFLLVNPGCQKFTSPQQTKQSYQSRTNNTTEADPQNITTQPVDKQPIYLVAGTVKNEIAAIDAAKKFENYDDRIESKVFRGSNGVYIVTVGQSTNTREAQELLKDLIEARKIPEHTKLAYNRNWIGPVYSTNPSDNITSSTGQGLNPNYSPGNNVASGNDNNYTGRQPNTYVNPDVSNQPRDTYSNRNTYNEPGTVIPNTRQPGSSNNQNRTTPPGTNPGTIVGNTTGLYYVVVADSPDEDRAILIADRYIEKGLVVFVYETTQGYKVTVGKELTRENAEAVRQGLAQQQRISANIVPDSDSWKRLVYP